MFNNYHRNSRVFIVVSWLLTRLWLGIEISRLAMFRATPVINIHRMPRCRSRLVAGNWVLQHNRLYYCGVSEYRGIIVKETQPLEIN